MEQIQPPGRKLVDQADVDFAVILLNSGASPEEAQTKLVERGLDQGTAMALVRQLLLEAIYAEAATLLKSGVPTQVAEERLVEKGLEPKIVKAIINDVEAHPQVRAQPQGGERLFIQFLGGLVFVVGICLLFGNVTGIFPTFPFAGFIVTTIGGVIWGVAHNAG
jgi:hypothetical protein